MKILVNEITMFPGEIWKLFNANSNISDQNYFKFCPVDFFQIIIHWSIFWTYMQENECLWWTKIWHTPGFQSTWLESRRGFGLNILIGYHKLPSYKTLLVLKSELHVYNFQIYKGRDTGRTTSLGEHVVRDMMNEIEFSYRQVYFDNYFTTPNLLEYLCEKWIYAVRTIRVNRKNMLKDCCCSKKKMNRVDFEYITSNNLVLHKWMDQELVFALSNFHDPTS